MPIYEYTCRECSTKFEALRSFKEADAPIACQQCGSLRTGRQISVFFAQSGGRVVAGGGQSCSGCAGGTCSSCNH